MSNICFITGYYKRLEHLKITLPKNLENNSKADFLILDYGSCEDLYAWISQYKDNPRILYYRFTLSTPFYHKCHAKNIAHRLSTHPLQVDVDADNFTGEDFDLWVMDNLTAGRVISPGYDMKKRKLVMGCGGRIGINRDNFMLLTGYDERMTGWGFEDSDFINRSRFLGLEEVIIPTRFLTNLTHSDSIRYKYLKDPYYYRNRGIRNENKRNKTTMVNDDFGYYESRFITSFTSSSISA
jgi:predicted glycosyltransferase involved in capsule biosynthesis